MALSREALRDYDERLAAQERAAADYAQRVVADYLAHNPGASVADIRDYAVQTALDAVGAYGDAASSLAADLYDELAEGAGMRLRPAAIDTADVSGRVDKELRYQAGKLVDGATDDFVRACGMAASDQVSRRANATMRKNARRDGLSWARIPMGGEACEFCLMLASRGFAYKSAKTAGEGTHYHRSCRCKVVPDTAGGVEGYDPDKLYRIWHRVDSAKVVARDLYEGGAVSVAREAEELDGALRHAWTGYSHDRAGRESYQATYGTFIRSMSSEAPIDVEGLTSISGKELQLGGWLSKAGYGVTFRNADNPRRHDPNSTSDAYIDGELWEFKRIASSRTSKLARRVTEKLDRQGPNFVVDLSTSAMDAEAAEIKVAELLEDERIERVLLVKSNTVKRFEK